MPSEHERELAEAGLNFDSQPDLQGEGQKDPFAQPPRKTYKSRARTTRTGGRKLAKTPARKRRRQETRGNWAAILSPTSETKQDAPKERNEEPKEKRRKLPRSKTEIYEMQGAQLRQELKSLGLKRTGTKAEMSARLIGFYTEDPSSNGIESESKEMDHRGGGSSDAARRSNQSSRPTEAEVLGMRNAELRQVLVALKLPKTGNKNEMRTRILKHINEKKAGELFNAEAEGENAPGVEDKLQSDVRSSDAKGFSSSSKFTHSSEVMNSEMLDEPGELESNLQKGSGPVALEEGMQSEPPTVGWDCKLCTFNNIKNKITCEMCKTKRDISKSSQPKKRRPVSSSNNEGPVTIRKKLRSDQGGAPPGNDKKRMRPHNKHAHDENFKESVESKAKKTKSKPVREGVKDHVDPANPKSRRKLKEIDKLKAPHGKPNQKRFSKLKGEENNKPGGKLACSQRKTCANAGTSSKKEKQIFKGFGILPTGLTSNQSKRLKNMLVNTGATLVKDMQDAKKFEDMMVVSNRPKRTMKALFYYARGLIPVSMKWVKKCLDARQQVQIQVEDLQSIPGTTDDFLAAVVSRECAIPLPMKQRVLHGVSLVLPATLNDWAEVIREAGALPISEKDTQNLAKGGTLYILCMETDDVSPEMRKAWPKAQTLHMSWMVNSIAAQRLENVQHYMR